MDQAKRGRSVFVPMAQWVSKVCGWDIMRNTDYTIISTTEEAI